MSDTHHDDFGGLQRDLAATDTALDRRGLLRLGARFGAAFGALQLVGCSNTPTSPTSTATPAPTATTTAPPTATTTTPPSTATCARVPEETAGPYPGDGSNGPTVLTSSGVVRSDIRSSFAGLSGTAGATNQNYLRGIQQTDTDGRVSFTSIYPACYSGRWPHIHFEVFPSLTAATNQNNKVATSQIALPKATNDLVYAVAGYEQSIRNAAQVSLTSDMVFSDGASLELATFTGSVAGGLAASLTVAVNA